MFWGFVGIISKVFCFNVCRSLTLLYVGYTPITRCCVSVNIVKHILGQMTYCIRLQREL